MGLYNYSLLGLQLIKSKRHQCYPLAGSNNMQRINIHLFEIINLLKYSCPCTKLIYLNLYKYPTHAGSDSDGEGGGGQHRNQYSLHDKQLVKLNNME